MDARDILRSLSDAQLAEVLCRIRGRRVRREAFEAVRAEVLDRAARRFDFEALYAEVVG